MVAPVNSHCTQPGQHSGTKKERRKREKEKERGRKEGRKKKRRKEGEEGKEGRKVGRLTRAYFRQLRKLLPFSLSCFTKGPGLAETKWLFAKCPGGSLCSND